MKKYFVTGIGTDIGKTVISAILTEALKADYWKPVQAGTEPQTDSQRVKNWISNSESVIHPEGLVLADPMSPHAAADRAGVHIELSELHCPKTDRDLVIEGAGGLLVPLSTKELVADMIPHFDCEVILVSRNYLGSINHSLLTWEVLKERGYPVRGIVFNGKPNPETESYILEYTGLPCLLRVGEESSLTKQVIKNYAAKWNKQ